MSGHSKWATTHRQKSAADAKKGAIFTKLGNLIVIAAREGGSDPTTNFKLRLAVDKAREANMPKDNIERAIKKGTGEGSAGNNFEKLTYEVFGPEGSAFLVEAITDNKNRTVGEIKTAANKNGGQLATLNSVAWMFERNGFINLEKESLNKIDKENLELELIDAGAKDIIKNETWEIITEIDNLQTILEILKNKSIEPKDSGLAYFPKNELRIDSPEAQQKIENFYSILEDLDDVTNVFTNATW